MAEPTDKKRLRQVQQQDLTESRLNDDFVFWLKTKGWNYLLVLLVIACAWSFLNLYWQRQEQNRDAAWASLNAAQTSSLPEAFAEVAKEHPTTDSVAILAWLNAADAHLKDLQAGMVAPSVATAPDGTPNQPEPLTAENRKLVQDAADGFYAKVLEAIGSRTSEVPMRPLAISALFGRAAIAESRGTIEEARTFLTEAETLAGETYPPFAAEAKRRLETLSMLASSSDLPSKAILPTRGDAGGLAPNVTDELSRSLTPPPATTPATTPATEPVVNPDQRPGG